jgi:hypothetical protein
MKCTTHLRQRVEEIYYSIVFLSIQQQTLSKKEIEDLLKKGAYGSVMDDDEASSKYVYSEISLYIGLGGGGIWWIALPSFRTTDSSDQ